MPWNNVLFTRTDGTRTGSNLWTKAKNNLVKILSVDHDTHDQDMADGINNCLTKDGQNQMVGDLDVGNNDIVNVNTVESSAVQTTSLSATIGGSGNINVTSGLTFGDDPLSWFDASNFLPVMLAGATTVTLQGGEGHYVAINNIVHGVFFFLVDGSAPNGTITLSLPFEPTGPGTLTITSASAGVLYGKIESGEQTVTLRNSSGGILDGSQLSNDQEFVGSYVYEYGSGGGFA